MDDEYVSRKWLIDEYHRRHQGPPGGALKMIEEAPAADVVEVKHGRWIDRMLDNFRKYECACSECGARYIGNYDQYCEPDEFYYCPRCGAKMDGDEDEGGKP